MPSCSCPHCGRTGIPFALSDAHTVFECRQCGGTFTPLGGAVSEAPEPLPPTPGIEGADWPDESPRTPVANTAVIAAVVVGLISIIACCAGILVLSDDGSANAPSKKPQVAKALPKPTEAERDPTAELLDRMQRNADEVERMHRDMDRRATAWMTGYFVTILAASLIGLALWGTLLAYTVTDCRKRDPGNEMIWALVVCAGGLPGFVAYLVYRQKQKVEPADR